jgi:hypothetical protein
LLKKKEALTKNAKATLNFLKKRRKLLFFLHCLVIESHDWFVKTSEYTAFVDEAN